MMRRWPIAGLLLLAACGHAEAFRPPESNADRPLMPGAFPVRLTYNRGQDRDASWLPDGSGLVYSAEQFRFEEGDWCLSVLPPTGGRVVRKMCHSGVGSDDSLDAYRAGSVSPSGVVAFVRVTGFAGQLGARLREIVLTDDWRAPPRVLRPVLSVPFTAPDTNRTYSGASRIRWLDGSAFVFRGDFSAVRLSLTAPPDSVDTGRDLVLVRLVNGAPQVSRIPGTGYASSLAVRSADEIYFTRGGDSRVFRRRLSTGDTSVVWDFGGPIVRGVQLAGDRMIVLLGGSVVFDFDPLFQDSTLTDFGGFLWAVDLATNAVGVIDQFALYRNPALSPDGRRLVVESVARAPDLFLFDLP